MQKIFRTGALLAGALNLGIAAQAQSSMNKAHITQTDIAVTYSLEHSQVAAVNGNSFWLKGGSFDAGITFLKGLGIAANLNGEHASNVVPGVDFNELAYMAGPRYTFNAPRHTDSVMRKRDTQVFGEVLFGGVHGFGSVFPAASGVTSTANAFSMQAGGGIDTTFAHGFGARLLELDFIHTTLPNNASNTQNDLRIAFGISYRR